MMRVRPLTLSPQQRGVMWALLGISCLGLSDALVKWLGGHYGSLQLVFVRNLISLLLL